jgi:sulfite exporter TauE/SafE
MSPEAQSSYTQLMSLGLVWVSVHCVGMCGPLLVGLDVAGVCRGLGPARGAGSILLYQSGRALTYTFLGALVGVVGAGLKSSFELAGAVGALAMSAILVVTIVRRLRPSPRLVQIGGGSAKASYLEETLLRLQRALLPESGSHALRTFVLGMLMGFLPCMITAWVLGLAAVTASPFHGAGVMLTLVAMTTPVLLGVTLVPRALKGRLQRLGRVAPATLLGVSALWLLLVGLAGLGVLEHAHLGFSLFGRGFSIMFW